jgi:hypothetical protein
MISEAFFKFYDSLGYSLKKLIILYTKRPMTIRETARAKNANTILAMLKESYWLMSLICKNAIIIVLAYIINMY